MKSSAIARENSVTDLDLKELDFAYINEFMDTEEMAVLRLADLANMYSLKQELGIEQPTVNKTRLNFRGTVPFKSKLTVCCKSRFSIPARIEYAGSSLKAKVLP